MLQEIRKIQNEVLFREANEELRRLQATFEAADADTPFFCECDEEQCRTLIQLAAAAYEHVRSNPLWFLIADGHSTEGTAVERHDGYFISEKHGQAAEIAEERDPRKES
jgi:hypothetical protein